MGYKVLTTFADLQDNRFVYKAGDTFPRDGAKVSANRLKELSGPSNKLGKPLIEKVEPEAKEEPAAKEEIEKKTTKKKRSKDAD